MTDYKPSDLQKPSPSDLARVQAGIDAGPAKPRTPRKDAHTANIKVQMPIADAAALSAAMKSLEGLEKHFPAGAIVTVSAGLGRI